MAGVANRPAEAADEATDEASVETNENSERKGLEK